MDARPGIENLCCLNSECKVYGLTGRGNLRLRKVYGADHIRYLRCGDCGSEFSERKGTALFNCKISEAQVVHLPQCEYGETRTFMPTFHSAGTPGPSCSIVAPIS